MSVKDIVKKVVCIGDASSGKTALITRFTKGIFPQEYNATIGCDFSVKILKMNNRIIRLRIWDLGGDERFEYLRNVYYKATDGAIILFDLTNPVTFDHISHWITEMEQCCGKIPFVIGGNKSDLTENRRINQSIAQDFAKGHNALYCETSAKDGSGVDLIFQKLSEIMIN